MSCPESENVRSSLPVEGARRFVATPANDCRLPDWQIDARSLTPGRREALLAAFVGALDRQLTAEDVALNVSGCVGCNQCGQACAWYLETGLERLHSKNRADFVRWIWRSHNSLVGKLRGAVLPSSQPTLEDVLARMGDFWACTLCGRCTLPCPMGISNRSLFRAARAAYAESGLAELNPTLRSVIENSRNFRHSWGMNPVEVVARAGLFLTFEDTEIPLDVSGAEYYFACPAAGNTKIPDLGIQLLQILNAAGVSYTVSTEIIDTGTEAHHVAVHEPLALELLLEWERNAERLNAKKVLVLECGCDVRTMYVEATQLLGRPFKLPFVSIDSLFLEIVETGALPTEKLDLTLTLHDPCYVNRLAGLGSHARALLRRLATRFVEMQPNGPMNYCCNAGAGGMRIPENTGLRRKVSRLKAKQIEATNADGVVAPCVICYLGLQDTVEHYKLGAHGRYRVRLLFEIIYESMMRALVRSNSVDRIKTPKVFTLMRPAEVRKYSLSGYMRRLRQSPIFPGLMRRYRDDPLVRRYAESHSGFWRFFDELSQLGSFSDRVIP